MSSLKESRMLKMNQLLINAGIYLDEMTIEDLQSIRDLVSHVIDEWIKNELEA